MSETHLIIQVEAPIAPRPASRTSISCPPPQKNAYITRTTLSNGYVAYRAVLADWLPDYKYLYRSPCPQPLIHDEDHYQHDDRSQIKWNRTPALLPHKCIVVSDEFPLNRSSWPGNCVAKKGHLRDVKPLGVTSSQIRKEQERERRAVEETVWWLKFDCRAVPEEMRKAMQEEEEEKERVKQKKKEKTRSRGGRMVWRKKPRFRGSGKVVVLDDPAKDGKDLAFEKEILPSDFWRDNRQWKARTVEEDEGIRMDNIIRGEPAYTIRTLQRRAPKKTIKKSAKKQVSFKTPLVEEIPYLQAPEFLLPDSVSDCGLSVGSDSGCEYESVLDFSEDEALGWVPVMVREDQNEEEEGWVSLTGSWMMLGGTQEAKKMVKL